jgi:hypothetical protein
MAQRPLWAKLHDLGYKQLDPIRGKDYLEKRSEAQSVADHLNESGYLAQVVNIQSQRTNKKPCYTVMYKERVKAGMKR